MPQKACIHESVNGRVESRLAEGGSPAAKASAVATASMSMNINTTAESATIEQRMVHASPIDGLYVAISMYRTKKMIMPSTCRSKAHCCSRHGISSCVTLTATQP